MQAVDEIFVRETRWFFHIIVRKEIRISGILCDDLRVESAKVVAIQLCSTVSFRGDIHRLVSPIDPRIVFLELRHTKNDVFFTTICDVEQDFVSYSANAEEKCGRKFNFSTGVDRRIDIADSDGRRKFRVGKMILLDEVIVKAVNACSGVDEGTGKDVEIMRMFDHIYW